ncbi:MAG: diaminopimelate decarboxylase [Culturomica sp.]|jgi:diaminopimelate decarboxylase|nr:diaminopimelate decarboxylase [Culturomica sp.]
MELTEYIGSLKTPCYYYDIALLRKTLETVTGELKKYKDYQVHYAIKANANPVLLKLIASYGLGADCVSGNEIQRAIECGFPPEKIVYAGVGKSDWEIETALNNNIFCFNCESVPEIEIINEIAARMNKKARIALRINPNIDAHTHQYITTGTEESKFGIYIYDIEKVIALLKTCNSLELIGLHFHVGSQITEMEVFQKLSETANDIQQQLAKEEIELGHINFGGGLGIDYQSPYNEPIADFANYFATFADYFEQQAGQKVHFELGRAIIAHCGDLISKVLYVKESRTKKFAVLDAGMNDLLRPALYQAFHKIENISSDKPEEIYDVVGPICESSDFFGKNIRMNAVSRGDIVVVHTAGAYGETMSSRYNLRELPLSYFSE